MNRGAADTRGADDRAALRVERFTGPRDEWDAFVDGAARSTVFHRSNWLDVIERHFGYRRHDLVARRDGRIAGILPLCELAPPFGRRCLMSLPFAVEAGVCADDDAARRALAEAAIALGRHRRAAYLELRDGAEPDGAAGDGFATRAGLYFRFRRTLQADDAENLDAIPRKQRRMIRVAQAHDLRADDDRRHLAVFHDLYARTAQQHGSPVFALSYFRALLDSFGDDCGLLTVWRQDVPLAGVLSFFFRGTVLPYYAGSRRELLRYAPNDFMYWELMRRAVRRGVRCFDFGRSKLGTGAFAFKQHWGFDAELLRYRVCAFGAPAPARSLDDRWMRRMRHWWSRLPLSVTKLAGPALVRRIGPFYT